MTKHTPTPWKVEIEYEFKCPCITNGKETIASYINQVDEGDAEANAEHIVKCVNLHDELVKGLENAVLDMEAEMDAHGDSDILRDGVKNIRNILLKAEGV